MSLRPTIRDPRLPDRFWAKVEVEPSGCWLWTASLNDAGYGVFRWEGQAQLAHRVAYAVLVGAMNAKTLGHSCRVRSCVNPTHLIPMSERDSIKLEIGPSAGLRAFISSWRTTRRAR